MSPTVWAVTFGGTLIAAATIIALACCRAAVREGGAHDEALALTLAKARANLDDLTVAQGDLEEAVELAFLRGAATSLQKAAQTFRDHPDWDAGEYLQQLADQIILDRPAVWS